MLTLISFIILMVGAINWFCIGLLQFDFVAGLFGSQSSIFSRIVYFIVGLSALVVLYNLISNRGRIVFDFKNKRATTNDLTLKTKNSEGDVFEKGEKKLEDTHYMEHQAQFETSKEFVTEDEKKTPPNLSKDHEDDDFLADEMPTGCGNGCNASHVDDVSDFENEEANPLPHPKNIDKKHTSNRIHINKK